MRNMRTRTIRLVARPRRGKLDLQTSDLCECGRPTHDCCARGIYHCSSSTIVMTMKKFTYIHTYIHTALAGSSCGGNSSIVFGIAASQPSLHAGFGTSFFTCVAWYGARLLMNFNRLINSTLYYYFNHHYTLTRDVRFPSRAYFSVQKTPAASMQTNSPRRLFSTHLPEDSGMVWYGMVWYGC